MLVSGTKPARAAGYPIQPETVIKAPIRAASIGITSTEPACKVRILGSSWVDVNRERCQVLETIVALNRPCSHFVDLEVVFRQLAAVVTYAAGFEGD